ncbi:hypothetical protein [Streptomyces rishiriensis]|uniref:Uncharacterized protein n=1 Tax=Streptomyces rishiriensis TaxID=68264 RepID=A0ABU0NHA6_STRRH|nr:hypothetical protein [Streptomyces rishiriensis]MDQ0578460.1 hypothetical protein [Streptomyces rishiriensis]
MLPPPSLAERVRHALTEAGFHLSTGTDAGMPGLEVIETPEGVLIRWTASDEFQNLTHAQLGGGPNDGVRAMVQAAVSGLLEQQGHVITAAEGDDLLVLPTAVGPSRQR